MVVNSDQEEFQQFLPEGLVVEKRLPDGSFGLVLQVRDERSSLRPHGRLAIRVISKPTGCQWEEQLKNRISKLSGRFVSHLSPLVEAGRLKNDDWYLGYPLHSESLATKLKRETGQSPGWVERLAEQLLIGLAELHRRGIAHGNIRPENVFLDFPSDCPNEFVVNLGDAATGGIAVWSQGEFLGTGARHYRQADSTGSLADPTSASDLYAVGIVLAELLIGTESVATAKSKSDEHKTDLYLMLREYTEFKSASGRLRRLIRGILTPSEERRLTDANDALSLLRQPSRLPGVAWGLVVLATLSLLLITMLWLSDNHRLKKRQGELESELSSVKQSPSDSHKLMTELKKKPQLADNPIPVGVPNASATSNDSAQKAWGEIVKRVEIAPAELVTAISQQPEAIKAKLNSWSKLLEIRQADAAGWERADPQGKLQELLREAIMTPWSQDKLTAVDGRLKALRSARDWWKEQIINEKQTPDGITRAIGTRQNEEQEILRGWEGQFSERTKWQVRLKEGHIFGANGEEGGHAESNIGKSRSITVYKNGEKQSETKHFAWPNAFTHKFEPQDEFIIDEWHPGDSLRVLFERGSYGGDSLELLGSPLADLADGEFKGPYAMQKLNWESGIKGAGVHLTLEVVDCPGPPLPQLP